MITFSQALWKLFTFLINTIDKEIQTFLQGLVSDGLSFEEFVAVDDGVAIGPGAKGLKLTTFLISCTLQVITMLISKMMTMNIPSISLLRHSTLLSHVLRPL